MLHFVECPQFGYKARTLENCTADATLAFAIDFTSAGEILTKKSANQLHKFYHPINITYLPKVHVDFVYLINQFNIHEVKSLHIAGNGLYTMKGKFTQEEVDNYIFSFLNTLLNHSELNNKIEYIRTGGQTGIDEAGAKASIKLGIDTLIYAPKGWKFRNIDGVDISDEKLFKERF